MSEYQPQYYAEFPAVADCRDKHEDLHGDWEALFCRYTEWENCITSEAMIAVSRLPNSLTPQEIIALVHYEERCALILERSVESFRLVYLTDEQLLRHTGYTQSELSFFLDVVGQNTP